MFQATSTLQISSRSPWVGSSSSVSMKCLVLALRGLCDMSGGHVEFYLLCLSHHPFLACLAFSCFPHDPHRDPHTDPSAFPNIVVASPTPTLLWLVIACTTSIYSG